MPVEVEVALITGILGMFSALVPLFIMAFRRMNAHVRKDEQMAMLQLKMMQEHGDIISALHRQLNGKMDIVPKDDKV